jgi:Xaa-Pro aminopeptidase
MPGRRVGLIEPDSYRLPGIPYRDMTRLIELNPATQFTNCTTMLEEIRRKKSAEEIAILRQLPAPAIRPTSRELRSGDVVMIELSKGGAGYAGQVHGMITLGPATDDYAQMAKLAQEAYRSILAALHPGCTPREAADAAFMITRAGYTITNPLIHGFGMGRYPITQSSSVVSCDCYSRSKLRHLQIARMRARLAC